MQVCPNNNYTKLVDSGGVDKQGASGNSVMICERSCGGNFTSVGLQVATLNVRTITRKVSEVMWYDAEKESKCLHDIQ